MIFGVIPLSNILLATIEVIQLTLFLKSKLDMVGPCGKFSLFKKYSYHGNKRYNPFCDSCHTSYEHTYMPGQLDVTSYISYILAAQQTLSFPYKFLHWF